jgi:hypothetical protein
MHVRFASQSIVSIPFNGADSAPTAVGSDASFQVCPASLEAYTTLEESEPSVLPASQQLLSVGQLAESHDVVGEVPIGERSTQFAPPSELSSNSPPVPLDGGYAMIQQCCVSGHEMGPGDKRPFGREPTDHVAPPLSVRQTIDDSPSEDEKKVLATQN